MNIKDIIEKHFDIKVSDVNLIGEGYDSKAYLINNEYVFKIKFSANKKKGYTKEKAIYDFVNKNMDTEIKIPKIEYSFINEELSILGYKQIKGKFLKPELYYNMTDEQKNTLKKDIAKFLRQMHDLDYKDISTYIIDNKQNVLEEYQLLRETIYDSFSDIEKQYIESFMEKLNRTTIFNGRKCLCHNDFSCNHLLIDDNNRLTGIIDFGDSGIIDEYCDFIYLLENSDEEIGEQFGIDILKLYGNIDIEEAKEYQDMVQQYYPIETIVYGIKNNKRDFIEKGRKEMSKKISTCSVGKIMAICGKICSGKTYYSNKIKEKENAIILSCEELTKALFNNDLGNKHDEMAIKIWDYLMKKSVELAKIGCNVILDWGFWTSEQRRSVTKYYKSHGITCEWHYIDIEQNSWYKNIEERNKKVLEGNAGFDYYLDDGLMEKILSKWEIPDKDEIDVWYFSERKQQVD